MRVVALIIVHAFILNDLSFAAPELARHLAPDNRFNPMTGEDKAKSFKDSVAFAVISELIGKYLLLGISEHTLIPEIQSHLSAAEIEWNSDNSPLLKGFAIKELRFDKTQKAFFLPLYRNGVKSYEYKFYVEGDPKNADITIPLKGGKNIYIRAGIAVDPVSRKPEAPNVATRDTIEETVAIIKTGDLKTLVEYIGKNPEVLSLDAIGQVRRELNYESNRRFDHAANIARQYFPHIPRSFTIDTFVVNPKTRTRIDSHIAENERNHEKLELRIGRDMHGSLAYEIDKDDDGDDSLLIHDLRTAEEDRHDKGEAAEFKYIGLRLIQAAVLLSKTTKCRGGINLSSNENNQAAQGFYESLRPYGLRPKISGDNIHWTLKSRDADRLVEYIDSKVRAYPVRAADNTPPKPEAPNVSTPKDEDKPQRAASPAAQIDFTVVSGHEDALAIFRRLCRDTKQNLMLINFDDHMDTNERDVDTIPRADLNCGNWVSFALRDIPAVRTYYWEKPIWPDDKARGVERYYAMEGWDNARSGEKNNLVYNRMREKGDINIDISPEDAAIVTIDLDYFSLLHNEPDNRSYAFPSSNVYYHIPSKEEIEASVIRVANCLRKIPRLGPVIIARSPGYTHPACIDFTLQMIQKHFSQAGIGVLGTSDKPEAPNVTAKDTPDPAGPKSRGSSGSLWEKARKYIKSIYDPLKPIEAGDGVEHSERQTNIALIRDAAPYSEGIEKAYDAMVADVLRRARNKFLPEDMNSIVYIIEKDAPENYVIEHKDHAEAHLFIHDRTLVLRDWMGSFSKYNLLFENGDLSSVKVDVGRKGRPKLVSLTEFVEENACDTRLHLKRPMEEILGWSEVEGIGISNGSTIDLYRSTPNSYVLIDTEGDHYESGLNTGGLLDPSLHPYAMRLYGDVSFTYHFHPFCMGKDKPGEDLCRLSRGDANLVKSRCSNFGYAIPEIIWSPDGENAMRGVIHIPVIDKSGRSVVDFKKVELRVTLGKNERQAPPKPEAPNVSITDTPATHARELVGLFLQTMRKDNEFNFALHDVMVYLYRHGYDHFTASYVWQVLRENYPWGEVPSDAAKFKAAEERVAAAILPHLKTERVIREIVEQTKDRPSVDIETLSRNTDIDTTPLRDTLKELNDGGFILMQDESVSLPDKEILRILARKIKETYGMAHDVMDINKPLDAVSERLLNNCNKGEYNHPLDYNRKLNAREIYAIASRHPYWVPMVGAKTYFGRDEDGLKYSVLMAFGGAPSNNPDAEFNILVMGGASQQQTYDAAAYIVESIEADRRIGIETFKGRINIVGTDVVPGYADHGLKGSYSRRDVDGKRSEIGDAYWEDAYLTLRNILAGADDMSGTIISPREFAERWNVHFQWRSLDVLDPEAATSLADRMKFDVIIGANIHYIAGENRFKPHPSDDVFAENARSLLKDGGLFHPMYARHEYNQYHRPYPSELAMAYFARSIIRKEELDGYAGSKKLLVAGSGVKAIQSYTIARWASDAAKGRNIFLKSNDDILKSFFQTAMMPQKTSGLGHFYEEFTLAFIHLLLDSELYDDGLIESFFKNFPEMNGWGYVFVLDVASLGAEYLDDRHFGMLLDKLESLIALHPFKRDDVIKLIHNISGALREIRTSKEENSAAYAARLFSMVERPLNERKDGPDGEYFPDFIRSVFKYYINLTTLLEQTKLNTHEYFQSIESELRSRGLIKESIVSNARPAEDDWVLAGPEKLAKLPSSAKERILRIQAELNRLRQNSERDYIAGNMLIQAVVNAIKFDIVRGVTGKDDDYMYHIESIIARIESLRRYLDERFKTATPEGAERFEYAPQIDAIIKELQEFDLDTSISGPKAASLKPEAPNVAAKDEPDGRFGKSEMGLEGDGQIETIREAILNTRNDCAGVGECTLHSTDLLRRLLKIGIQGVVMAGGGHYWVETDKYVIDAFPEGQVAEYAETARSLGDGRYLLLPKSSEIATRLYRGSKSFMLTDEAKAMADDDVRYYNLMLYALTMARAEELNNPSLGSEFLANYYKTRIDAVNRKLRQTWLSRDNRPTPKTDAKAPAKPEAPNVSTSGAGVTIHPKNGRLVRDRDAIKPADQPDNESDVEELFEVKSAGPSGNARCTLRLREKGELLGYISLDIEGDCISLFSCEDIQSFDENKGNGSLLLKRGFELAHKEAIKRDMRPKWAYIFYRGSDYRSEIVSNMGRFLKRFGFKRIPEEDPKKFETSPDLKEIIMRHYYPSAMAGGSNQGGWFKALGALGIGDEKTTSTDAAADIFASTESERIQATRLIDTIKLIKDAKATQPVILALGTSWIKGYRPGEPQYKDLNHLITAIRNYCRVMNIDFVDADDKDLLAEIEKRRKDSPDAKVVVLAGKDSIAPKDAILAPLRNDENTFLAAVDSDRLDETCYVRLVEMLRLAMELGLKEIFRDKIDLNNPNIKMTPLDGFRNVYVFLPRAERIPVYENLRALYRVQEFA